MTHEEATTTLAAERYLLGEMNEAERGAFEAHYFTCVACAEDVRVGALMREGSRAGFLGSAAAMPAASASSATVVPFAGRRPTPAPRARAAATIIPWAIAASLACFVGYQSLVELPALRRLQAGPLALAPLTLRPASRGTETTVVVGPNTSAVTFAIDGASSTVPNAELTYDLRTPAGTTVLSGHAVEPTSGPLLLLVPARFVSAPGHYVLTAGESQYRFEVTPP